VPTPSARHPAPLPAPASTAKLATVSYDETHPAPAAQPSAYAPPPDSPPQRSGASGWLVALGVIAVLALGGLAAAIISKGDSGSTSATIPSVSTKTTTVQQNTTTVTTPAPNVTVAPNVTLAPSGSPAPAESGAQTSTAAKTPTTTTP
jgi:predicted lipid-binding transport protein (Tim44 family)